MVISPFLTVGVFFCLLKFLAAKMTNKLSETRLEVVQNYFAFWQAHFGGNNYLQTSHDPAEYRSVATFERRAFIKLVMSVGVLLSLIDDEDEIEKAQGFRDALVDEISYREHLDELINAYPVADHNAAVAFYQEVLPSKRNYTGGKK